MIDLADRESERRQPRLLLQRLRELRLHGRQLPLGGADLVAPVTRLDDAAHVLGTLTEADHVARDALHRPDQRLVQHEVDERCGEERDRDREAEDAQAEPDHGVLQRALHDDDLDLVAAAERRRSGHAYGPVAALQVDHQRVAQEIEP